MHVASHMKFSRGARRLAAHFGTRVNRFSRNVNIPIINWGCNVDKYRKIGPGLQGFNRGPFIINPPQAVLVAQNKLDTFRIWGEEGVRTPDWVTNAEGAMAMVADGDTIFARTLLRASKGKGIEIVNPQNFARENFPKAPLYVKYIPDTVEFRVHVVGNAVIDIQRKTTRKKFDKDKINRMVRNVKGGWIYVRSKTEQVTDDTKMGCIHAVQSLGLDFGAVDVLQYIVRGETRHVCLEVNTAPGLESDILFGHYSAAFERFA